jgi:hypothetical protein
VRRRWKAALASSLALLAFALPAAPAEATFHLMSIREVYPGSVANPSAEYVELQMWAPGQNFIEGHVLRTYTAAGVATKTIPAKEVKGDANQSTIVFGGNEFEAGFPGIVPDAFLNGADLLDPAGGAVCWENLDCVAWGSFSGMTTSPAGTLAPAIPDGMALRRKITAGCPTLLEATDDTDNSAADFEAVFPNPRPNSVAPTEHACGSGPGPGGGGGAPQTLLRRKPPKKTSDRTPTFRFSSDNSKATFQCKLDGKPFRACRSPFTARRLGFGKHTFRVRAVLGGGDLVDSSPASFAFRVVRKPR